MNKNTAYLFFNSIALRSAKEVAASDRPCLRSTVIACVRGINAKSRLRFTFRSTLAGLSLMAEPTSFYPALTKAQHQLRQTVRKAARVVLVFCSCNRGATGPNDFGQHIQHSHLHYGGYRVATPLHNTSSIELEVVRGVATHPSPHHVVQLSSAQSAIRSPRPSRPSSSSSRGIRSTASTISRFVATADSLSELWDASTMTRKPWPTRARQEEEISA